MIKYYKPENVENIWLNSNKKFISIELADEKEDNVVILLKLDITKCLLKKLKASIKRRELKLKEDVENG